jgi:DNA-binding response OmpR family regulator
MNKKIAVLDDEADIVKLVSLHLKKNSFDVFEFSNANSLFKYLTSAIPDLLVLDLMLPDMDGIEICKKIKNDMKWKNIPIIMLTAKQDETDKILGLEFGADDYVTKPFSPKELIARIKAVLRRGKEISGTDNIIEIGGLIKINLEKYEVFTSGNKKIELTTTEFKILQILSQKKGWVFSREKLLDSIWGEEKYVIDRTIDVHIKHLREKLSDAGKFIKNVRGVGYKIEE